jgi:hypothetical protein
MEISQDHTVLYICFDPNNRSLMLPFKESADHNYYLDVIEDEKGKKIIKYGGKDYEFDAYENCQLMIRSEEQPPDQKLISPTKVLQGRKVQ